MANICVIADDMTGACDSALQFFNLGLRAVVVLSELDIISTGADAIAVSTNRATMRPSRALGDYGERIGRFENMVGAIRHGIAAAKCDQRTLLEFIITMAPEVSSF